MRLTLFHRSLPIVLPLFTALAGCPAEPGLSAVREPHCEARSTKAPGRLNLDTRAEQYGTIPPCLVDVSLAIARNTDLRTLEARVLLTGAAGEAVYDETRRIDFEGPSGGMWRAGLRAGPVAGQMCRALALQAQILRCLDEQGRAIECPAVRVRESLVLQSFDVHGADVDVCFDD